MTIKILLPLVAGMMILLSANALNAHPGFSSKLKMLNHEIEHTPNDQNLYMLRGRTYSDKGKYQQAMKDFHKAEALGDPVNVAFSLGVLHYRAKEFDQSKQQFDRYLKANPDHPESLEYRARMLRDAGDYKASLADFERFFELRKNPNPGYYISAAQMLLALPDDGIPAAITMLDKGIEQLGLNPQLQYFAVELERRSNNYEQAIERMLSLQTMLGNSPKWKADLGKIKQQAGDKTAARTLFVDAKEQLITLRKTPVRIALLAELELLLAPANKK